MHETTAQTIIASIIKLDQEKREKRKDGKLTNVFFYTFRIGDKWSNEIKKKDKNHPRRGNSSCISVSIQLNKPRDQENYHNTVFSDNAIKLTTKFY